MAKAKDWTSFEKAREWARESVIKTSEIWCKAELPANMPKCPNFVYKGEWKGWKNFLGNERMSFEEAREWARALGIKKIKDWRSAELPANLPKCPDYSYKDEWKGWADFLGDSKWMSFEEAREWARESVTNSRDEWQNTELPDDMPRCPYVVYKKEWGDWYDFLGTPRTHTAKREWRSLEEVQEWARENEIRTVKDWQRAELPSDIPRSPWNAYGNRNWIGWKKFFEESNAA